MTAKRKISVRKVLQAFVTLLVTTACLVAILGASKMQKTKTLNRIHINIENENKYQFLNKTILREELIDQKEIKEGKTTIENLDIHAIEKKALKNPWIASAQVYLDYSRNMFIKISQRVPVARIFYENGKSCYLDTGLKMLPLSDNFSYYTTIVTNVPELKNDSVSRSLKAQIIKLVHFVERDSFWSAQIAQISIGENYQFDLVPVLGKHIIRFGDTTNMQKKFKNLFAFYTHVLNRIGWDKYEELDLRFDNQLVASPAIPWKPPARNAVSNLDWLKNIMEKETANAPMASAGPAPVSGQKAETKPVPEKTKKAEPAAAKHVKPKKIVKTEKIKTEPDKTEKKQQEPQKQTKTGKYIYQGRP